MIKPSKTDKGGIWSDWSPPMKWGERSSAERTAAVRGGKVGFGAGHSPGARSLAQAPLAAPRTERVAQAPRTVAKHGVTLRPFIRFAGVI